MLSLIALIAALVIFVLVCNGYRLFSIFTGQNDNQTVILFILGALSTCLASILAITTATFFLTVQNNNRGTFVRALRELHSGKAIAAYLVVFLSVLMFDIASMVKLQDIVTHAYYIIIDLNIILSCVMIAGLAAVVMRQVENVDQLVLAGKLSRHISYEGIHSYRLVQIDTSFTGSAPFKCTLHRNNNKHGALDPLGAFHELMMQYVRDRDRITHCALVRTLLNRIARTEGAPYPPCRTQEPGALWRLRSRIVGGWHKRRSTPKDRLALTVHIFHYVIRQADNLRRDWGEIDATRQQYLSNLRDLIAAISDASSEVRDPQSATRHLIDLSILAAYHIELTYGTVKRSASAEEILDSFVDLAAHLHIKGFVTQATRLMEVLAFLAAHGTHLSKDRIASVLLNIPSTLRDTFHERHSHFLTSPLAALQIEDPWEYRLAGYEVLRPPNPREWLTLVQGPAAG